MSLETFTLSYGRAGRKGKTFRFSIDTAYPGQSFLKPFLARNEVCDPPLTAAIAGFLDEGDVVFDVGANVGYYTMQALQNVGKTGAVYAFEANPEMFRILTLNGVQNRAANLHAFNVAVSDRPGTATFYVNPQEEGTSSLHDPRPYAPQGSLYDTIEPISVAAITLDEYFLDAGLKAVKLIKIDVEGFEPQVLEGGRRFIQKYRPDHIVFEVSSLMPGIPAGTDLPIRHALATLGYTCHLIRPMQDNDQVRAVFRDKMFLHIPESVAMQIRYGNVIATRQRIDSMTGYGP
jgi:FkbM family methyltransferase